MVAHDPSQDLEHRVNEHVDGGIWQLYRLRQGLIADLDFDSIARTHGRAVLRECCGRDVTDATVDMLVDSVLEILTRVVRDHLN